jgi:lysophospholipase
VIDEMGSYDPMLSAFTPTKYLGTTNSTSCVTGYDQAAFVTGTSSELFNEFNVSVGLFSICFLVNVDDPFCVSGHF